MKWPSQETSEMSNNFTGDAYRPRMIVVAGPNGSGKTMIISELLKHEWLSNCVHINPDEIAQNQFGDWNSPEAVIKAADQARLMREDCLARKDNFVFETVFSSPDKLDFLRRGVEAEYFIRLFFVATSSPSINASRVSRRVANGGHAVPIDKINSRYTKSIANSVIGLSLVDRGYVFDNSIDNIKPRLLFRTVGGEILKKYAANPPDWATGIESSLKKN